MHKDERTPRFPVSNIANYGDGNSRNTNNKWARQYYASGSQTAVVIHTGPCVVRRVIFLIGSSTNSCIVQLFDSSNTTTTNKRQIAMGGSANDGTNTGGLIENPVVEPDMYCEEGLALLISNGGTTGNSNAVALLIHYDELPKANP